MNADSYALARAIRGPVVLITIGVLFALDRFTVFSFAQTWPAILIVFGLLSLAGAIGPRRQPPLAPPPPVTPPEMGVPR